MTNAEIIFREACSLMERGIIHGSGQRATVDDGNGNKKIIELPESIHTFSAWKKAGYIVKKGEHAIAAFPVWKYAEKHRNDDDDGDGNDNDGSAAPAGRMFMKKAFFFTFAQVEKITK